MKFTQEEAIASFWSKVKKSPDPEGCWIWTAARCSKYGRFGLLRKTVVAHALAWELTYGPVPKSVIQNGVTRTACVLVGCGTPYCVRPDHLYIGSRSNTASRAPRPKPPTTLESYQDRFWSMVDMSGGPAACWLWLGCKRWGYGQFRFNGATNLTHRLAATWAHGTIPAGMVVMHTCDVRHCCNPAHLKIAAQAENVQDMWSKGRGAPGRRGTLNADKVRLIRAALAAGETRQSQADKYGVKLATISSMVAGRIWSKVD